MILNDNVEHLYQIKSPHFCAGIVFTRYLGTWTVTEAAPIVKYMQGWPSARVKAYVAQKGWEAVRISYKTTFKPSP